MAPASGTPPPCAPPVSAPRYVDFAPGPERPGASLARPESDPLDGMPLHLHRSASNRVLWDAFSGRFLEELGDEPGPGFPTHAWFAHRTHRDLLLESAEGRGIRGWVGVPFSFLADLPERLGVEGRPAGLLTRRRLLARLAAREGRRYGIATAGDGRDGGVVRGHVLDSLFGEMLPEGVEPDLLRSVMDSLGGDDFSGRRNAWVAGTYGAYLTALRDAGLYDPRAVPALLATAVRSGSLSDAVGGAGTLHLYGLHSLRTRTAMVRALADQVRVEVHTYLPPAHPDDEWERLATATETLPAADVDPGIKPAPDQEREMRWVAKRVKELLVGGDVEPHRVAVVARTGLEDTRRAHQALEEAGVAASARIRTPLSEVAALRFVLELVRGAADDWPYRTLRNVLSSPYLDVEVEVWLLDRIADERRVRGLDGWRAALGDFRERLLGGEDPTEGQQALAERVEESRRALERFAVEVASLSGRRPETDWIQVTRALLDPGILWFRHRLSRPVRERWDVVRLDQRGVLQLEALLDEWSKLELDDEPMDVGEWHALLARLLEGHTLTLSTPMQRGVQVLEAHDAALTPWEHVFLVHANDGEFPRLRGSGGVFTEEERQHLHARLPLSHRELDLRRERTLWQAVTGAARVTVSYRTTDPSGQPLLPSLLVPEHDPGQELSRIWTLPGTPLGREEWLLARAGALREPGGRDAAADGLEPPLEAALVNAVAEWERALQERTRRGADLRPSPWSGHLRDPVVRDGLARRFGPDRIWSASQLERYATCPFLYLVERVLGLAGVEEAEEETSALTFGGVAHEVLERFYRTMERPLPSDFDGRAAARLDAVLEEVRKRREAGDEWLGIPVLWRQTLRRIREAVEGYLRWELPLLDRNGHAPVETEYAFGFGEEDPVHLVGLDRGGAGVELRLRGRIDRVDVVGEGEGARYHVIDYKSGMLPSAKGYLDGSTLQAALYLSAWTAATGLRGQTSGYRSIKSPTGKGSQRAVRWEDDKHRAALAIASSIPGRLRAGHFEPVLAEARSGWASWDPGREVTRGRSQLEEGSRFDARWEGEGGGRG